MVEVNLQKTVAFRWENILLRQARRALLFILFFSRKILFILLLLLIIIIIMLTKAPTPTNTHGQKRNQT